MDLYICVFTGQVVQENPHDDSMVIIDDVPKTGLVDVNPSEPHVEDDFDSVSMTNSYKYVNCQIYVQLNLYLKDLKSWPIVLPWKYTLA